MLNSTDSAEAGYIREHGPVNGLYDNHLSIMGVKVLGDGALGSRGSALLEDYSDDPGNRGSYRFTDEEIYNVMSLAYNNGYPIAYHAIGDGANHQVLNTYERLLKENPREDPRLRIEHFQVVTPEDIDRALELGILHRDAVYPCHLGPVHGGGPPGPRAYSDGLRLAHRSG